MFKLESYITPVILSYVEKYVKNFKPEQSQVSLWGGDASFQNLDLRLEVLEEQLNLPFTLVSGHIHELLIHVPWVKITSEPIVVTINTIECILKLKDDSQNDSSALPVSPDQEEDSQEEAPPGYIKSIVTKVINNITINCNNLILKYVEEDIVLSINVRFLSMQTVNDKWEPAFTDITSNEAKLQKIIEVQDLTLCLDKMDTSGKIEIYQDPVLYRCSMTIRLIMNYHGSLVRRASITRLDLHCKKMEFSLTEQQIPMVLRLFALLTLLQSKQTPTVKRENIYPSSSQDANVPDGELSQVPSSTANVGWGMWAWNTLSSVLPVDWENDWSNEQRLAFSGHIIHSGFYIDDATITFKVVESVKEQLFYKSRKIKYKSFLTLEFSQVVLDAVLQGISMTNVVIGFGSIHLYPRGSCSCGYLEVLDGLQPPLYLIAGIIKNNYLKETLFDTNAVENQGKKRTYNKDVSHYIANNPISSLLERCPAFCIDYVHCMQIPDEVSPEQLAEYGSNYEYSNFHEERYIRYSIGNLTIRLSSGLLHRIETIKKAADKYNQNLVDTTQSIPSFHELPPVTVEEYEALRENIPMIKMTFYLKNCSIQLQLADHLTDIDISRQRKVSDNWVQPLKPALSDEPFVSIETDVISASLEQPLYPFRLVACACKQTDIPPDMLFQCYWNLKMELQGVSSQVYLKSTCKTSIIMPFDVEYEFRSLFYPTYWKDPNTVHKSQKLKIENVTLTGTKAKIMAAFCIVSSLIDSDESNNLMHCSSLSLDACNEKSPIYIEMCLENIEHFGVMCASTTCGTIILNAMKIFAHNETEQVFLLSGPELEDQSAKCKSQLRATVQFSRDLENQAHPSVMSIQIAPIKSCLDPLFFQWLEYTITYKYRSSAAIKPEIIPAGNESTISETTRKRKSFSKLHESVHSSDKEKKKTSGSIEQPTKQSANKTDELKKQMSIQNDSIQEENEKTSFLDRFAELYMWWTQLVVVGSMGHLIVYIPTKSISGIGVEGIEEAKDRACSNAENLDILVMKCPAISIYSSNAQPERWPFHFDQLPIKKCEKFSLVDTPSFPWTIELLNFESYTLKGRQKLKFFKKACLKVTCDLKAETIDQAKPVASSLSMYVDTSPIIISISEEQIVFLHEILAKILSIVYSSPPPNLDNSNNSAKEVRDTVFNIPKSSSSPTQIQCPEDVTTASTISGVKDDSNIDQDQTRVSACIQWTTTKISIKLYATDELKRAVSKLVLELEDIITSVDLQPVYLKLKHKITTATIFHYTRSTSDQVWDTGEFVGLMLCGREDNFEKNEDSGFLSLTLTVAKSGNVHTRWGMQKTHKMQKRDFGVETGLQANNQYITEAVFKIQMIDLTLPPSVIAKYMQFAKPFRNRQQNDGIFVRSNANTVAPFTWIAFLKNDSIPLIYLESKGLRLMFPAVKESVDELQHDLLMLQLESIRITPHAENPICRVPFRPDIYQLAAQANILNVPGSAVEDRQYQINVEGICIHTTTWKNYQQSVAKRLSQSYLYTMNENPAVEWNKLGHGSSLEPHFSSLPIISRFDFCLIIAPAVLFKPNTLVCASAAEINCLTDLELIINLHQIELVSTLCSQFQDVISCDQDENLQDPGILSPEKENTTILNPKNVFLTKQSMTEYESDYAKDSGIDFETSSITSTNPEKMYQPPISYLPFEFLVNCGKITITVYDIRKKNELDDEYVDEANALQNDVKQPLLYSMVNQPNIYFSQQYREQKLQISCFDVACFLGEKAKELNGLPNESNFTICLVETRSGDLHPDTGIPPSFLVIKCNTLLGKNPQFYIDMGRPTKLHFSLDRLDNLMHIKDQILSRFETEDTQTCKRNFEHEKLQLETLTRSSDQTRKFSINDVTLTSNQLVLSCKTNSNEHQTEVLFSLASLSGSVMNACRPERISGNISWDSFIISTFVDSKMAVLMNPFSCNMNANLIRESWYTDGSPPIVQVQANSDCLYFNIGPKQLTSISALLTDIQKVEDRLMESLDDQHPLQISQNPQEASTQHEQHYQDDLKSGAFQFVDANSEELPFPYQVVFYSNHQSPGSMAWRYPHPRALTRIHVSPVPLQEEFRNQDGIESGRLVCAIEYWNESHASYQRHLEFYLSETDSYRLDLPESPPLRAVACIWRVVLVGPACHCISSKALVACLRVDSYFNPRIVPNIQLALNVKNIHCSLYNDLESISAYESLPGPLVDYELSGLVPEAQCFARIEHKFASFHLISWPDNSRLLDISGRISIRVIDYALLTLQEVLDSATIDCRISSIERPVERVLDLSLSCSSFALKLNPSTFHAITLAAHLWSNVLDEKRNAPLILTTRYVIANDTSVPIRFGQSASDDNILLKTRQCHLYSWRHTNNQVLRIAVEDNSWSWSKPFFINVDGTFLADFSNTPSDVLITITVSSLSASQKLVTFSGQLLIINRMIDNFEMKLVKQPAVVFRDTFRIPPNSRLPSIVLTENITAMRLRFSATANLPWTGDIPLQPNARWGQPWLVKVPLQERGNFISIWVRVVVEQMGGKHRILAIISPLYMIRSYLPIPAKVRIETPSLKTSLDAVISGCGNKQQLYCPGTFEHFHKLTFQIESGVSVSNPYVPLSYSSVDQHKYFKRPEKENIDKIIKEIESLQEEKKWPFQIQDSHLWKAADQPQTHVQVKYIDAGFASTSLLLELQPWCLILNSLGTEISVISQDVELCRIPHYGIVAPPKLEGPFHIAIPIANTFYLSGALNLISPDWSQSFYISRTQGSILPEGNIQARIDCHNTICIVNIKSNIHKDMRVIRINSSHVIGNMTSHKFSIAALAVPTNSNNLAWPDNLEPFSVINVLPSTDESKAIPILQWHTPYGQVHDSFSLYISIRVGEQSWSCPVRIDQNLSRKCLAISNESDAIPVVVTTQEDKGTIYIMIHVDEHPQLFIENKTLMRLVVGQANEEMNDIVPNVYHFSWTCKIPGLTSRYYSTPNYSNRVPDLANSYNERTFILISVWSQEEDNIQDTNALHWSKPIELTSSRLERILQLDGYGDVKIIMQTNCYTTRICVISSTENVSRCTSAATFVSAVDDLAEPPNPPSPHSDNMNETVTSASSPIEPETDKLFCKSATIQLQECSIIVMKDDGVPRTEIASLCLTDAVFTAEHKGNHCNLSLHIGDLQLDNQIFERGGFDFPVVLMSQKPFVRKQLAVHLTKNLKNNVNYVIENSLLTLDSTWETDQDKKVCKHVAIKILPINAYIEGTYITVLMDYLTSILPACYVAPTTNLSETQPPSSEVANSVSIPSHILIDSRILSEPLRFESFVIEPVSILLSLHTSVHLYIALDHSPLYFESFERQNLITTPYRLGNALAMHYLSGAIFGVGWVVGSLEILGSPGGLAQALGTGLRDFVSMPFQGLLQGPWGFIVGVTHGSASLVKHITAGTVNSVTKLASSVARNLDRLTLDEEHLQRQEESRRTRPQGVAQGLYQGLTGLGMSLLAAVAGLAHHPLQQVWSGEASTRGLVSGVGRGLVGVVTKPLSGAAELVALTGQGLLQGTGWNSLPMPRQRHVLEFANGLQSNVTCLRYVWRLMPLLENSHDSILHVSSADHVLSDGGNRAVTLVLTRKALLIVNVDEDSVEKIYSLKDLSGAYNPSESTMLKFYCSTTSPSQRTKKTSASEHVEIHMDQAMRARVAEFLRTSSTGITSISSNSDAQSETQDIKHSSDPENMLTFYMDSGARSYLLAVFNVAKKQIQDSNFVVI